MKSKKPKILMVVDYPNWAFDFVARSVRARLSNVYDIKIHYSSLARFRYKPSEFDLVYVFYWAFQEAEKNGFLPEQIVKEVASYRWQSNPSYGAQTVDALCDKYLSGAATVATPCKRIQDLLLTARERVFLVSNGAEPSVFNCGASSLVGPMKIGWVGNPRDPLKGLEEILDSNVRNKWQLELTTGRWNRHRVAQLYREIDVLAITSISESQPLPLIEGLMSGAYIVTTDVGIVPEVVLSDEDGLVVDRTPKAFFDAFEECDNRIEAIRLGRQDRAARLNARSWDVAAGNYAAVFADALALSGIIIQENNSSDLGLSGTADTSSRRWRKEDALRKVYFSNIMKLKKIGNVAHMCQHFLKNRIHSK